MRDGERAERGPLEALASSFGYQAVAPEDKASRVRGVFDAVAERYDLMNDLMSGGLHRLWKDAMLDWLAPRPGWRCLDVAGGTGDVAQKILGRAPGARVTVLDVNAQMIEVGRDRAIDQGVIQGLDWMVGDAMDLPFPDRSFDCYTIAFGIRNVTRVERALAEARRVLKRGGRFLCLEFSTLRAAAFEPVYDAFSFNVVPKLGRLVADDEASYRYLVESIRRFPDQARFAAAIEAAGFEQVRVRNLTMGVAALHSAWRL